MKLYLNPVSTTSLPIFLFLTEHNATAEIIPVSLLKGEHLTPEYAAINPNKAIPALADEDFILTESSAILKYLADKFHSDTYPSDLRSRARVNEAMDWFNTGFYRDLGYGVVYPRIMPTLYGYTNPDTQADVIRRATEGTARRLSILNDHMLREGSFLCGEEITIADYLGSCFVAISEWVDFDLGPYPNVERWMRSMKARPSWGTTHGFWDAFVASLRFSGTD